MLLVMLTWLAAMWWMRWGMATLPEAEEEPITPVPLLTELTGDGLRDIGDGVPMLLVQMKH